jgi:hypothetical protein
MDAQRLLFCALCFFIGVQSHCQLKIGGDPYRIHPYALLELESSGSRIRIVVFTISKSKQIENQ